MFDSFMDRLRPHLRKRDAPDLTGLDVLLIDNAKGNFHWHGRVPAAEFKQVDLLAALKLGNAVVDSPSRVLG